MAKMFRTQTLGDAALRVDVGALSAGPGRVARGRARSAGLRARSTDAFYVSETALRAALAVIVFVLVAGASFAIAGEAAEGASAGEGRTSEFSASSRRIDANGAPLGAPKRERFPIAIEPNISVAPGGARPEGGRIRGPRGLAGFCRRNPRACRSGGVLDRGARSV